MCSVGDLSPFVLACVSACDTAAEEERHTDALLPSMAASLRSSVLPASAASLPCWEVACASALYRCCLEVSSQARSDGWRVESLAGALSAMIEAHRTCHSHRAGLTDLNGYVSCRRHFLLLLAARSADLPPFAREVLSAAQCHSVIQLADTLYFPYLHLSQLVARRCAKLTCRAVDDRRAQQPDIRRLPALTEAANVTAATTDSQSAAISSSTHSTNSVTTAATADHSGDSQQAAVVDSVPPSHASSSSALRALSALQDEFSSRLRRLQLA